MMLKSKPAFGDDDDSPSHTGLCSDFYVFKWALTELTANHFFPVLLPECSSFSGRIESDHSFPFLTLLKYNQMAHWKVNALVSGNIDAVSGPAAQDRPGSHEWIGPQWAGRKVRAWFVVIDFIALGGSGELLRCKIVAVSGFLQC